MIKGFVQLYARYIYLMRWRIEEYFKFKKQSFDFENLRVQSLKSIRNLDLLLTIAIGYVAEISGKSENIRLRAEIIEVSKMDHSQ
mgnify:CR=1 FL=1